MQSRDETRGLGRVSHTGLCRPARQREARAFVTNNTLLASALSVLLGATGGVAAQDFSHLDLRINGFLTAGATISDSKVQYLTDTSDNVSFQEDSAFGLQIGVTITDQLSLDAQVLAAGDKGGEFDARVDWAFATFRVNDNVAVRGGRIRLPVLLVSEYQEVGYTYPWIKPPQELYDLIPFNAVFGADVLLTFDVGPGQLLVQPYAGATDDDVVVGGTTVRGDINSILGGVVAYEYENFLVRAGGLRSEAEFDPPLPDTEVEIFSVGGRAEWNNIVGYAEYIFFGVDRPYSDENAWYATLGYRYGDFLPFVTYAQRKGDDLTSPFALSQQSYGLGLRYEVNDYSALKFQWEHVKPKDNTAGLFRPNPGQSVDDDTNVFSLAFDLVF